MADGWSGVIFERTMGEISRVSNITSAKIWPSLNELTQ
jgi:hypothetical protein